MMNRHHFCAFILSTAVTFALGCAGDPVGGLGSEGGSSNTGAGGGGVGGDAATGGSGAGNTSGSGGGTPVDGLGPWTGTDNVPPSADPPFGLSPSEVPMFVTFGWDDNAYSGLPMSGGTGGMKWATDMLAARTNPDGSPVTMSFYMTATYIESWISESPTYVKQAWNTAYVDGHEIGNHTTTHATSQSTTASEWNAELTNCNDWLTKPFDSSEPVGSPNDAAGVGVPSSEIFGFRTPFLEYNDATLQTLADLGFWYDCSIEEGWQLEMDGTNYYWPFTLDGGSPGHEVLVGWGLKDPISNHPGLWQLPLHPVVVPPDSEAANYGIPTGLRAKLNALHSWFDVDSGKITGFDYNLWVLFAMTKAEVVATLKYTLDLRLQGNRAPFMFGTHTDDYSTKYTAPPNSTATERQEAMEEFLDYALSKPEVRVKSMKEILDWVRNPVTL